MTPIAIALAAWVLCSVPAALLVGRVLGGAETGAPGGVTVPDHIPADVLASVDLIHGR